MQPLIDLKIAWIQIAAKTIFRIEELAKYREHFGDNEGAKEIKQEWENDINKLRRAIERFDEDIRCVEWNPVTVDCYGKIVEGEKPDGMCLPVFVTWSDGSTEVIDYNTDDDGFGDRNEKRDYLKSIIAWAYIELPNPYKSQG